MIRFLVATSSQQYEFELGRWYFIFYGKEGFTVFYGRGAEFTFYSTVDGFILACALLASVILALWQFRRSEHHVRVRDVGIGAALLGLLSVLILAGYGLGEGLWVLGTTAAFSLPAAGVLVAAHLRRFTATTVLEASVVMALLGLCGAATTVSNFRFSMVNAMLLDAGALLGLVVFGLTWLWFWAGRRLCARLARAPSAGGDSEGKDPTPA